MAQLAGVLALLLSALGLYGVTAYALSCRRGEIGIRLALGAVPRQMVLMILTRISALTLAGVAIGIVSSMWASRFMASLVYGASPRSPHSARGVSTPARCRDCGGLGSSAPGGPDRSRWTSQSGIDECCRE
jgi:ABC-type antimicrobial peptide transport system permease subunit